MAVAMFVWLIVPQLVAQLEYLKVPQLVGQIEVLSFFLPRFQIFLQADLGQFPFQFCCEFFLRRQV